MKNLILLLATFITLQSCGEDKKVRTKDSSEESTTTDNVQNINSTSNELIITLNADFNKNDELIIFWKDKNIGWFTDEKTIYGGASDIDGHQTIVFKFPNGAIPNDLRFDISNNKEQKEIKVNFIKLQQGPREFYIFGDELTKYFKPNEFISYNAEKHKLILSENKSQYDPYLNTTHDFILELQKVLNTTF